ncbi:MAG: cysteine synthase A [Candidatus Omnitrophica bacterium]|nr:cysteine synthase A [Candidatus Omnitrophota bacterium]MCF7877292.1 cysteine synthase A [Candidatus Omnitrophota bacterium]MCF7878576.1 cysteine synthase A [Candidatus Omnitrophota bacterium]MCF7892656.1 cysteine synthase A [Candidatus Omnitrophota bacterium]
MHKIYQSITETIRKTPLVKINRLTKDLDVEVLAKIESFNPLSSIKDRIGTAMIEKAEAEGKLNKNSVVIEPTSGNTGIALAFVCAAKGYRLILTIPDTMSIERRQLLRHFGAEIILTEGSKGMEGAVAEAERLAGNTPDSFMPQQFQNSANWQTHYKTTGPEIWQDTRGKVDIFIAGVGTGGTITGVGKFLKEQKDSIKIIALEPSASAVLSGGKSGPHKIQGIGAGFIPEILDQGLIDEIMKVSDQNSGEFAKKLAKKEGIFAGISSGAAIWAAVEVAKRQESKGKTIVTVLPDTGERYLSVWSIFK